MTPPTITYVAQEESGGCLVACVAMVTGRTYKEVRALCADAYNDGIHDFIADNILEHLGFAIARRWIGQPRLQKRFGERVDRAPWPCDPFAPAHICLVHATLGPHAVVMLHDGVVYDPWSIDRHSLRDPVYTQVDHVTGVWKVLG